MERALMDKKESSLFSMIKDGVVGFFIGVANIIPGVSGGTFLLIFGIYQRVIGALNGMSISTIKELISLKIAIVTSGFSKKSFRNFYAFMQKNDFVFLIRLVIGALVAIVVLSTIMKMLLTNYFSVTYSFFFGLILVSIIIPIKLIKEKKLGIIVFLFLGVILTIYTTMAVNPYDKAKLKSDRYQEKLAKQSSVVDAQKEDGKEGTFKYIGKYSVSEFSYAALCGAVAISAMVLPGISGSLILILMGEYFEIISAISGLKHLYLDYILFLGVFALGMGFGLLLFARLVDFVFKRFYNATMAFLIGLMFGSLYALWPFKKYVVMDQYIKASGNITLVKDAIIYTNNNIFPNEFATIWPAFLTFIIGIGIMSFFVRYSKSHKMN